MGFCPACRLDGVRSNTYGLYMTTTELDQTVARNVANAMEAAGENPSSLARAVGIHRTTLTNKLTGKFSWKTPEIAALAGHFDIKPSDLMEDVA